MPQLCKETTDQITRVLTVCFEAWGYDKENFKLWGVLNLSLTFWLWLAYQVGNALLGTYLAWRLMQP